MVSGIISLFSFPNFLLQDYINETDICILILYTAILPNLLMSSSSILVVSLGFSMYIIMSFANNDSFSFSFLIWISFIFSCLSTVARTSKTLSKKRGKSGHVYLLPDLRENAFRFSLLSKILTVCLSNTAFIVLRYVPSMPTFWRIFIVNELCKRFFCIY